MFQEVPADENASEGEKSFMKVIESFVTDLEATKLMQPRDRTLDDPTGFAQAATMFGIAFGNDGLDGEGTQQPTMRLGVVATVTLERFGALSGTARFASNRRNGLNQRQQLRHIVGVGSGNYARERDALRVGENVVLAPRLTAIGWVRSSFFPRCMARTDELSTTASARSSWSRRRNSAKSTSCKRCHTPVSCQSLSRRQQVTPEPQPISWGSISQGIPLLSTNRMPLNASRWPRGLRPAYCRWRFSCGGNNGSISFHKASSTRGLPKHHLHHATR